MTVQHKNLFLPAPSRHNIGSCDEELCAQVSHTHYRGIIECQRLHTRQCNVLSYRIWAREEEEEAERKGKRVGGGDKTMVRVILKKLFLDLKWLSDDEEGREGREREKRVGLRKVVE